MSAIDLGMDWNVSPDLASALKTEQERLEKNPQQKDGRKLTPAQTRDATFAAIAKAIEESDFSLATEILNNHPKLTFELGAFDIIKSNLLENFNRPLAEALAARGLTLHSYNLRHSLEKRNDPEMLLYFIDMCKKEETTHLLDHLYSNALKGFTANMSDLRRQELRDQRAMLEHDDPHILERSLDSEHFFPVFTTYTTLPQFERAQLESLVAADWSVPFTNWFNSFPNHYYRNDYTVGLKTLKSVLAFLNDFPFAKDGWNTAVKNMKTANQVHKDCVAQYFQPHESFETSQLCSILNTFHKNRHGNWRRTIRSPFSDAQLSKNLGLSSFEMQQLGACDWDHLELEEKNGQPAPFDEFFAYKLPSFIHLLVNTASQASLALLESEQGKQLYVDCFAEKAVLKNWCARATPEMINTVVRACPQLLEWTDNHNNSLAHYLVGLRKESSKTFGQLMARLNHNWLLHENDQGVSVKDLFKTYGASDDMLNTLDKEAIKRSVKDAGIKKTRRTDPSPKRRM